MISKYQIIILLFCIVSLVSCNIKNTSEVKSDDVLIIECGAEKWEVDQFVDDSGNYKLSNAAGRSLEENRSGDYSLRLTKENPYGMAMYFRDIKADDYFKITVWQKGNGHICLSDDILHSFYEDTKEVVETDSLGWQKLEIEYIVPANYKGDYLKVMLCNYGTEPIYFDDLTIIKADQKQYPVYETIEAMNIFISDESFEKLKQKREEALKQGILITEDDDWVKAIIFHENQVLNTRIRLKGDRLDHLQGRKWSFRIKIKGDNAWNGMKTFSIQTPVARLLLHEWLFHKALESEDLLCTRYGFVPVFINGESVGVYAWEEHFEKHLVEGRKRREGPILKLSDDSYWIYDKLNAQKKLDYDIPYYDASVVTPFDKNNILKDSLLLSQFKRGRDLYNMYKYAKGSASDIFDVEATAKYYAMTDATNAYHTLHFFNQRFYYNPVLGKLEPIFFDSFPYNGIFDYYGTDLTIGNAGEEWLSIHLKLLADDTFKRLYFKYLKIYSSRTYWEEIYAKNESDIQFLNQVLNKEFTNYQFDINAYYEVAEEARLAMEVIKEKDGNNDLFSIYKNRKLNVVTWYKGKADYELLPHLVNVYTKNENTFRVENYSTDSLIITGFSDIPQLKTETLDEKIVLSQANSKKDFTIEVQSRFKGHKFLFVEFRNKEVAIPIIPWGAPNEMPKYLDLSKSFNLAELQQNGLITVKADTLSFSGNVELSENLSIPNNWLVLFEPGTIVDFKKGATFISYSPIFVKGTDENPVVFQSSDNTGKGIHVFQTKQRSVIRNAVFTGLTNMDFGGWLSTGAVCFYEADVDLRDVKFESNLACDDALNIVRSDYVIENCIFKNTFADAFDSDFSSGTIKSTKFIAPGNDAIDFSGSNVTIENCFVVNAGDKSISCGEQSNISIKNCTFEGGNMGVASKDKSEVKIEDSIIKNVTYGLVAFCKKPEYGPAKIYTKNLIVKKYLFLHLIEEESSLNFNKREIFGQEKKLADRFY